MAKLPCNVRDLLQIALRRNDELAEAFIHTHNAQLFVPLFVLARAVLETGCLAWDTWNEVEKILATRDKAALPALKERLMNSLLGAKTKEWAVDPQQYQALNVLTIIDRLSKVEQPQLRGFYEVLSEFAHPNAAGMQLRYRVVDLEERTSRYQDRPFQLHAEGLDLPFRGLICGLAMAAFAAELYEQHLPAFVGLCEEALHDAGTWPADVAFPRP